jgi:hypothetical protein
VGDNCGVSWGTTADVHGLSAQAGYGKTQVARGPVYPRTASGMCARYVLPSTGLGGQPRAVQPHDTPRSDRAYPASRQYSPQPSSSPRYENGRLTVCPCERQGLWDA